MDIVMYSLCTIFILALSVTAFLYHLSTVNCLLSVLSHLSLYCSSLSPLSSQAVLPPCSRSCYCPTLGFNPAQYCSEGWDAALRDGCSLPLPPNTGLSHCTPPPPLPVLFPCIYVCLQETVPNVSLSLHLHADLRFKCGPFSFASAVLYKC